MSEAIEFICVDCKAIVYSWVQNKKAKRCMVCQWIYEQPNLTKSQIEEIRILTATPILEEEND